VQSIAAGITGYKGNVHLHFDSPLTNDFATVEQVTEYLDSKITGKYVLHPSNCLAYEMLYKKTPMVKVGASQIEFAKERWDKERDEFMARVSNCNRKYLDYFLKGYANPVSTKLAE